MKIWLTSSGARSPHPRASINAYAARVTKNDAVPPVLAIVRDRDMRRYRKRPNASVSSLRSAFILPSSAAS